MPHPAHLRCGKSWPAVGQGVANAVSKSRPLPRTICARHWCRQLFERGLSHRGLPVAPGSQKHSDGVFDHAMLGGLSDSADSEQWSSPVKPPRSQNYVKPHDARTRVHLAIPSRDSRVLRRHTPLRGPPYPPDVHCLLRKESVPVVDEFALSLDVSDQLQQPFGRAVRFGRN